MKRFLTSERFKDIKTDKECDRVLAGIYQDVLNYITNAVGPINQADEPLVCAAFETFACAIKAQMPKDGIEIYEKLRELSVTGIAEVIKK